MDNNWIIVEKYLTNGSVEVPQGPTTKISKVEGNISKGLVNITLHLESHPLIRESDMVTLYLKQNRKVSLHSWTKPPSLGRLHLPEPGSRTSIQKAHRVQSTGAEVKTWYALNPKRDWTHCCAEPTLLPPFLICLSFGEGIWCEM